MNALKVIGPILLVVLLVATLGDFSKHKKAGTTGHPASTSQVVGSLEDGKEAFHSENYENAAKILQPLAEQGEPEAQGMLGVMYEEGKGVPQDYNEAFEWYQRGAAQGHAGSQNNLGAMYHDGRGVDKDEVKAYMWLSLAATSTAGDFRDAEKNIPVVAAKMTPEEIDEAKKLVDEWQPVPEVVAENTSKGTEAAAEASSTPASTADPCAVSPSPGAVCADGTVFAGLDSAGKMSLYTTRCDMGQNWNGSVCSGTRSGITWNNGKASAPGTATETKDNETDGVSNTDRLIALNDAAAPYEAALVCNGLEAAGYSDWYLPSMKELKGIIKNAAAIGGFENSFNTPQGLYWSSTEGPSSQVAWSLIVKNNSEIATAKNGAVSVRCVRKSGGGSAVQAAAANPPDTQTEALPIAEASAPAEDAAPLSPEAQAALGKAYYRGDIVGKSHAQAIYWWRKAAEGGNVLAQLYLGIAYHAGDGVVRNDMAAVKWLGEAANQGNGDAQKLLIKYGFAPQ